MQSNFPVWGAMCSERGICVSIAPKLFIMTKDIRFVVADAIVNIEV